MPAAFHPFPQGRPALRPVLNLSSEQEKSMSKKKYIPPDGEDVRRRRFRWLLRQKPKAYPDRPRSNKNSLLKPIRRS
jgi:hypothetical protein